MSLSLNLAFYVRDIMPIGGVGTWLYYVLPLLKKYHKVHVFYDVADSKQLARLEACGIKCTNLLKETTNKKFDILFRSYDKDPAIKAKLCVHTLHACVSEFNCGFKPFGRIDRYLVVSKRAKESLLELYPDIKEPIDVVSNFVPEVEVPVTKPFNGTINMLIASRMSGEKGIKTTIEMVNELDRRQINYRLDILTVFPSIPHLTNGKVKFRPPSLEIDFSKYHYLVQLSDTESYCYSVHEALAAGTAVIVKDIPAFKGVVKHGYNGYIYPDLSEITNVPVRFEYKSTGSIDDWLQYIEKVVL